MRHTGAELWLLPDRWPLPAQFPRENRRSTQEGFVLAEFSRKSSLGEQGNPVAVRCYRQFLRRASVEDGPYADGEEEK